MKCTQPNCPGIIQDGYCNYCGMPATQPVRPGQVSPAQQAAAAGGAGQYSYQQASMGTMAPPTGAPSVSVGSYVTPHDHQLPNLLGVQMSATVTAAEIGKIALGTGLVGTNSGRKPARSQAQKSRSRIGAGITSVPPAEPVDPAGAIMTNPVVPEHRRFCAKCNEPVGRSSEGQVGQVQGKCPKCQTPFSFTPAIQPGELVSRQYEVLGALAYGGMGWIYLARDRNVSDRWVVLKGLINGSDPEARQAVKSEQEFLAAVEHPLIVEIYNFVKHNDARYIVMEYVPGKSLTELLKARKAENGGQPNPLPLDWALAYVLEVLPAFSYLHSAGLLYCDFKPDNLMQVGDSVKLIDLGAVRWRNDDGSTIFGTKGYQAPEIMSQGTSVASDIYTIGRSLMMMTTNFVGFQGEYEFSLPPVSKMPIFDEHDSFYRLVQRACAPAREDRFQSAEDLRVQMLGVLREVVSKASDGAAKLSHPSTLFGQPEGQDAGQDWRLLPELKADQLDAMHEWLTMVTLDDPRERLRVLNRAPQRTAAVILAEIDASLRAGDERRAMVGVQELLRLDPWDWRAIWYQGLVAIKRGSWAEAQVAFNTVYAQLPGELAPKFALAIACERADRPELAEALYAICAATDAAYVTPCAFALARLRLARSDIPATMAALELVPPTSRGYLEAQKSHAKLMLRKGGSMADLDKAYQSIAGSELDPQTSAQLRLEILNNALQLVRQRKPNPLQREYFGGKVATERLLRGYIEQVYQEMAKWAPNDAERNRLMALADQSRGWSLW